MLPSPYLPPSSAILRGWARTCTLSVRTTDSAIRKRVPTDRDAHPHETDTDETTQVQTGTRNRHGGGPGRLSDPGVHRIANRDLFADAVEDLKGGGGALRRRSLTYALRTWETSKRVNS